MTNDQRRKIIVADDDKFMRRLTSQILGQEFPEFELEFLEDGNSLEAKLNEGIASVRLIVTDNEMPGVHGSELIRRYAPKLKERKIPFVLLYGGDESIGQQAVKNGAFGYVLKPHIVSPLVDLVNRALIHPDYQI